MHALSSNPAIKETSMKRKILWAFLIIWLILTAYLLFLSNKWASIFMERFSGKTFL